MCWDDHLYPWILTESLVVIRIGLLKRLCPETACMRTEMSSEQRLCLDGGGEHSWTECRVPKGQPIETLQSTVFLRKGEGSHPQQSCWLWTRRFDLCYLNRSCIFRSHEGSLLDGPVGRLVGINLRGSTNLLRVTPTIQVAISPHGRILNSLSVAQMSKILDHTKNNSVLPFWSSGRRTVWDQQYPCLPVMLEVAGGWNEAASSFTTWEKHLIVTQRRHSTFASSCLSTGLTRDRRVSLLAWLWLERK